MQFLWLLLTIGWTCTIFYCSSLDAGSSGAMSARIVELLAVFRDFVDVPSEHTIRKLAHFLEFSLLGWLLWRTYSSFRISKATSAGYILLLGLLVAVVDEYIQSFSLGRSSQVSDVLLDFGGVFCTWLFCRIYSWSR